MINTVNKNIWVLPFVLLLSSCVKESQEEGIVPTASYSKLEGYLTSSDPGQRVLAAYLIAEASGDYDAATQLFSSGSRKRHHIIYGNKELALLYMKIGSFLLTPESQRRLAAGELVDIIPDRNTTERYPVAGERLSLWRDEEGIEEIFAYDVFFGYNMERVYLGNENGDLRILLPPARVIRR